MNSRANEKRALTCSLDDWESTAQDGTMKNQLLFSQRLIKLVGRAAAQLTTSLEDTATDSVGW